MTAFIKQRGETDCGVCAMAMLCNATYEDVYRTIPWRRQGILCGTDTKMLLTAAERLGYEGRSTPENRMKVVKAPKSWEDLPPPLPDDWWHLIPNNSLVKVRHPTDNTIWHWVAWRKGRVYDPARGVFTPGKSGLKPASYMHIVPEGTEDCPECGTPTETQASGIKCPNCDYWFCY